jgi:hypothetical protein
LAKIARSDDEELPKKFLGAWMHKSRKPGGQQLSCNNNFARAITAVIPDTQLESQGLLFKKWIPIAINKEKWMEYIEAYFEACKTIDEERDEDINEARPKTPKKHENAETTEESQHLHR